MTSRPRWRKARGTSTPARSTRCSTRSADVTIPTGRTAIPGSRFTSTTAEAFYTQPIKNMMLSSTLWLTRWRFIRAIPASGSRAFFLPRALFATSRPGSSLAASSSCTTGIGRAGWCAAWQAWPRRVFGSPPLVVSIPARAAIRADDSLRNYATYLLVGDPSSIAPASIRAKLAADQVFLALPSAAIQPSDQRVWPLGSRQIGRGGNPIPDCLGRSRARAREYVPTDDWPFPYLRQPAIPALNLRGMTIVAVLSLIILFIFAPVRRARPNAQDVLSRGGLHAA